MHFSYRSREDAVTLKGNVMQLLQSPARNAKEVRKVLMAYEQRIKVWERATAEGATGRSGDQ